MERLQKRDHIAYVRFASVYRNFQDLTEFYQELQDLDARSAEDQLRRYQQELPAAGDGPTAGRDRTPGRLHPSGRRRRRMLARRVATSAPAEG